MVYLPGHTVQCVNPDCSERGHWLRIEAMPIDRCTHCGSALRNVPPPLAPRFRMRTRPLLSYRPRAR
jgi:hypothetical protein